MKRTFYFVTTAILLVLALTFSPIDAARQVVNLGTAPNDGTGDSLRAGGVKINSNFAELYAQNPYTTTTQRGVTQTVYFADRTDDLPGTGTATDPFDATPAAKFDSLMRGFYTQGPRRIYLFPGTYKTHGRNPGYTENPQGWWVWSGMQLIGLGQVTLTTDAWIVQRETGTPWPFTHGIIGRDETPGVVANDVLIENITIDCNWQALTGKPAGQNKLYNNGTNFSNNQTVTIGATTYTFKTTLTPANNEVLIGANAAASLLNLARAINNSGGTPGTDYQVSAANASATSSTSVSSNTITITARSGYSGADTNSVATSPVATTSTVGVREFRHANLLPPVAMFGVNILGCNVTLRNVRCINAYGHWDSLQECFAISITAPSGVTVCNNVIDGCEASGFQGDYAVMICNFGRQAKGAVIRNSKVIGARTPGVYYKGIHNGFGFTGEEITFTNNMTQECEIGVYMEQSVDTGNIIRNLTAQGNKLLKCINIGFGTNSQVGDSVVWRNWLIEGNLIELTDSMWSGGGGIATGGKLNSDGTTRTIENQIVRGNVIVPAAGYSGAAKSGIGISLVDKLSIIGNVIDPQFTLNGTSAPDGGFESRFVTITGNRYSDGSAIAGLPDAAAPYAFIRMANAQTIATGSEAKVNFDTAYTDAGGMFNATTDKIIIPANGFYRLGVYLNFDHETSTKIVTVAINGRGTNEGDVTLLWKRDGWTINSMMDRYLEAGDELEVFVSHSHISDVTISATPYGTSSEYGGFVVQQLFLSN